MHSTSTSHRNPDTPHAADNADWLKTVAIISVSIGHFGYFFVEDDRWWSVFGRLAAPMFFFLMGYAQTRTVPLQAVARHQRAAIGGAAPVAAVGPAIRLRPL